MANTAGVILIGGAVVGVGAYFAIPEFKDAVDQAGAEFSAWLESLGGESEEDTVVEDNIARSTLEKLGLVSKPKPKPDSNTTTTGNKQIGTKVCKDFDISTVCVYKAGSNWVLFNNGNGCWRNKGCNGKISQLCLTKKNIGTTNTQQALNKLAAAWLSVYGCKKASMARTYKATRLGTTRT